MFNLWKNSGGGTKLSTYNILSQNKNTRIQKLNARVTAISLNSIDEKVRSLEGTSRAVPIDMKSLDNRINNLIANAKNVKYCQFTYSNNFFASSSNPKSFDITSKFGYPINTSTKFIGYFATSGRVGSAKAIINNRGGNFEIYGEGTSSSDRVGLRRVGDIIYVKGATGGNGESSITLYLTLYDE